MAVNSREFVDKHIHIESNSRMLFKRQNREIAEFLRRPATSKVVWTTLNLEELSTAWAVV